MPTQIVPVIMCGGAGTRLWPVSRESMPKQFVPLVGQGSTFQQVLARISHPDLFTRPIVITSADFRFVVAEQLRERGVEADIVLEPMRRDSGLAVAVSALLAAERDRDALVLVLAADHVVRKPDEFREACQRAAAVAAEGRNVICGTAATSCFTPRRCSARSSASSRRWPRPPRRRLPASRATSIFYGWQANRSHARPKNRSITPSCSVPSSPP